MEAFVGRLERLLIAGPRGGSALLQASLTARRWPSVALAAASRAVQDAPGEEVLGHRAPLGDDHPTADLGDDLDEACELEAAHRVHHRPAADADVPAIYSVLRVSP
jgi:hypothetical protein